jgi:Spy/CpxP family protein refolding chaperone
MKLGFTLNLAIACTTFSLLTGVHTTVLKAETIPLGMRIAQSNSQPQTPSQNRLNLTSEQQQRIQMILKNQNILIVSVLTPEQRALVQKAAKSNQKPGSVQDSLNLTSAQKAKIKSIQDQTDQQIRSVLTPEQLKIVDQQK